VAVNGDGLSRERWRLILVAVAFLLAAQLIGATTADAKRGLITGLVDSSFRSSSTQGESFDMAVQANAELVRIGVNWGAAAPTRPATPRDPADPAYRFGGLDATIRAAQARGLEVLLTVSAAPGWAEGPNRPTDLETAPPGTWDPDPVAFGEFGQALATRYSGGFVDPASADPGPLPRVRHFEAWNEPNLGFLGLGPQWTGGEPRSPIIYRQLLNSFYDGVKAANPDSIVMGPSLAPHGEPPGGLRMRPLLFLRELFCLEGRHKLKPKKCPPVKVDVLSVHPINPFRGSGGPFESAIHPDDAPVGDVGRLERVLRAAEKGGNVQPGGRRPLWATEFWMFRLDRDVPLVMEARWIEEALYLFWKQGIKAAIYFHLRDRDVPTNVPTGLFSADGTPKPGLQAFRFPFVTERRSRKRVRAWGKSPQQGTLRIERKTGGRWRAVKNIQVRRGEVFATKLRLRKPARLRATVAGEQSLTWRQRR
jgi:hypothetical protein